MKDGVNLRHCLIIKSLNRGLITPTTFAKMKKPLSITTTATLEIHGKEYAANIKATVYPAHAATRDDDGGVQEIEIEDVLINGLQQWRIVFGLDKPNFDRCVAAVQNKIESL